MNSDWELLENAVKGDRQAWSMLVTKYQAKLKSLALLISGSSQSAEDIVQETFMAAIHSIPKNRNGTVKGYLNTIAYRLSLKELHRLRREIDLDETEPIVPGSNQIEALLDDERDKAVAETILNLDFDHRLILVLRFYGEYTFEEMADLLQIPVGTAKSRLFYAVRYCRQELKRRGIIE